MDGWALPVSPGCHVDVLGVLARASVFVPFCLSSLLVNSVSLFVGPLRLSPNHRGIDVFHCA